MSKENHIQKILRDRIVAIIRLPQGKMVGEVVEQLILGGINTLEITTNTPNFNLEIEKVRKNHPKTLIGAGTVTNQKLAEKAIASGAQFLVTPNTNKEVAKVARNSNVPILMGAFTPTEVSNAMQYGADIIKLYPANLLGIPHFKAMAAPFDKVNFFAVGGITLKNIDSWLNAGINGLGIGGSLVPSFVSNTKDLDLIRTTAHQFTERISKPL
ncbi:bifunctional 4-hydroxy-2-oxoglutarate aldolase/2-dehydro-3-deoxy-phosphogluconate aldolase [Maribacter sp. 2304DJ31-5]|uniref:bifunctional 4-hydroxy-2-oxoglutarate aldolase/2-dehydro-3-deoxy-phosphogluconate aldolase n=1 Tax=Maribacter sp. 2304DJ31-5 TaxID=3386273 RepID=UPI0039BCA357